jgi:hypothetical protein
MVSEREYMTGYASANMPSAAYVDAPSPAPSVQDDADAAHSLAHNIHSLLDDLEVRIFGPEPRAVGNDAMSAKQAERPALAYSTRGARQRLEGACERLHRILNRL